MKVHVKAHLEALPNCAHCSDDLASALYRLAHAVPMVGLWLTPEPNHIFYWDYNRLIAPDFLKAIFIAKTKWTANKNCA